MAAAAVAAAAVVVAAVEKAMASRRIGAGAVARSGEQDLTEVTNLDSTGTPK